MATNAPSLARAPRVAMPMPHEFLSNLTYGMILRFNSFDNNKRRDIFQNAQNNRLWKVNDQLFGRANMGERMKILMDMEGFIERVTKFLRRVGRCILLLVLLILAWRMIGC